MMRTFAWSLALGLAACLSACGGEGSSGTTGAPAASTTSSAATTAAATTASATATATAAPSASETASAASSGEPSAAASGSAAPSSVASAGASGAPAASGTATAAAAAKKFDCGEKGQKACPMQGWMKSVMGSAVASGDGARIAKALRTIASKPVAGFGNWSAIASAGAAKADAGDIDGAKQSCKQCHDAYKNKYQTTMRDQPW